MQLHLQALAAGRSANNGESADGLALNSSSCVVDPAAIDFLSAIVAMPTVLAGDPR